jgi:hypothetical protein
MKKQMIRDYKKLFQKLADGLIDEVSYHEELKRLRKKYNTKQYIKY